VLKSHPWAKKMQETSWNRPRNNHACACQNVGSQFRKFAGFRGVGSPDSCSHQKQKNCLTAPRRGVPEKLHLKTRAEIVRFAWHRAGSKIFEEEAPTAWRLSLLDLAVLL
jgi:hypothetical protein